MKNTIEVTKSAMTAIGAVLPLQQGITKALFYVCQQRQPQAGIDLQRAAQ